MAMGAVLSSRSFGSPLVSGKEYRLKRTTAYEGKTYPSAPGEKSGSGMMRILSARKGISYVTRSSFSAVHISCALDRIIATKRLTLQREMADPLSNSLGKFYMGNLHNINLKRRFPSRTVCFISSDPVNNGWLQTRKLENFRKSDNLQDQSETRLVTRTRVDFTPEQYEITGSQFDSLNSSDVSSEAILGPLSSSEEQNEVYIVGGDVKETSPWWEQFPKRWLIVVLCFFSFLLCNMDRVNMSIAILPMSAEFNWNPATVGLIQSSFFWGYLLTQVSLHPSAASMPHKHVHINVLDLIEAL